MLLAVSGGLRNELQLISPSGAEYSPAGGYFNGAGAGCLPFSLRFFAPDDERRAGGRGQGAGGRAGRAESWRKIALKGRGIPLNYLDFLMG